MINKWKKELSLFLKGWTFSLVIALLIATSFKSAVADWNDIPTGSMKPTILVGDRIFINKLAYDFKIPYTTKHLAKWSDPKRGDIVVFYSPEDGKRLIKRVVGLPGDTIAMNKNQLKINGHLLKYGQLQKEVVDQIEPAQQKEHLFFKEDLIGKEHAVMFSKSRQSIHSFYPIVIPEGHYFMMGDNRDNSADSRFFGFVDRNRIVGLAKMVAMSRKGSFLHPRWNRFFKKLL